MSRRRFVTPLLALSCTASLLAGTATVASATSARSGTKRASTCPSAGGVKVADASDPAHAVKVYGHGWGHGMGMSQYGAQGAARLGCDYRTILGTYYAGSSVVKHTLDAPVLLNLGRTTRSAKLDAETGPVRWSTTSADAVQPEGSTWTVKRTSVAGHRGIAVFDQAGTRQVFAAGTARLTARHTGVVVKVHPTGTTKGLRTRWDSARFTGSKSGIAVSEAISGGQGSTAVQKYLTGLAEVPVSWPVEALKAQAVAARTYLSSKYSVADAAYVLKTTTADQVYRGFDQEKNDVTYGGRWRTAVTGTSGQVVVDSSGQTIEAMYSSSMGGHTENRQYVYGNYGISYLKAVDDSRWDAASDNKYRAWSKGFTKTSLAKRFGFDSVTSWAVAKRGSSARLNGVQISGVRDGETVTAFFTGAQAKSKLGLRSPGFVFGSLPAVARKK